MNAPIRAAGAVVWRTGASGTVEVAVVHRPRYDDWSLPKGKVDPGEARVSTAVREVAEETGYSVHLGRALGRTRYPVEGREKQVDHWAARVVDGAFVANDEVDALRWESVSRARKLVTAASDGAVLARFAALPAGTTTSLLVRHAKAGARSGFTGPDSERPLEAAGREQAHALVALARAFGVTAVHSADRVRCEQTVAPLAAALGLAVSTEPLLSEEGWAADPEAGTARALTLLTGPGVPLVCSQGGVIPTLVHLWSSAGGVELPDVRTRKASTWVLSWHDGALVAADQLTDPAV